MKLIVFKPFIFLHWQDSVGLGFVLRTHHPGFVRNVAERFDIWLVFLCEVTLEPP